MAQPTRVVGVKRQPHWRNAVVTVRLGDIQDGEGCPSVDVYVLAQDRTTRQVADAACQLLIGQLRAQIHALESVQNDQWD